MYFDALKRPYLLKKIQHSHRRKQALLTATKAFMALKTFTSYIRNVKNHVRQLRAEGDFRILGRVFESLKTYLYLKRCRKFALGGYGMLILKKAFQSLKFNTVKSLFLKNSYRQIIIERKKRALSKWVAEYDRKAKEDGAAYVVQFANTHQIITAWRQVTCE